MTIYINNFIRKVNVHPLADAIEKYCHIMDIPYKYIDMKSNVSNIHRDDILILLNRHLEQDTLAKQFERVGAAVLVFESPYIKSDTISHHNSYSVGVSYHNRIDYSFQAYDSGDRFESMRPLYNDIDNSMSNEYILICSQAKSFNSIGIGYAGYAQPGGWDSRIIKEISKKFPNKKIKFRLHPNAKYDSINNTNIEISNGKIKSSIYKDLENVCLTVVHTSNASTESLLYGIPVYYTGPEIYMKRCLLNTTINEEERFNSFVRMSWNQFTVNEIEDGLMFDILNEEKRTRKYFR